MNGYTSRWSAGDRVRVANSDELAAFRREWQYHTKLTDEQLRYGGAVVEVVNVGFYHGGDPLYQLRGLPGLWHEQLLRDVKST